MKSLAFMDDTRFDLIEMKCEKKELTNEAVGHSDWSKTEWKKENSGKKTATTQKSLIFWVRMCVQYA